MTQIDIQKFCAREDDDRKHIQKPHKHGEYVYATNGHILARFRDAEAGQHWEDKFMDKVQKLHAKSLGRASLKWKRDIIKLPPAIECSYCDGEGKLADCDDCNGNGNFEHGKHYYECKECNGAGRMNPPEICHSCSGTGKDGSQRVKVGVSHIARRYAELILALPNLEVAPNLDDKAAIPFRFDGGDGILMPLMK